MTEYDYNFRLYVKEQDKKMWIQIVISAVILMALGWLCLTILMQVARCPEMTPMELLKGIPNSFILNFQHC